MGLFDNLAGALGGNFDLEALAGQASNLDLGGLVNQFQQGGMGEVVQSWISSGANLPVSAEQLQAVLGSDMVEQLAGKFGVDASQLADVLPQIVDKLTPGGQLPDGLSDMIGGFFKS